MPFIFHREGKARRTDFVQRKFQDLLCVVTEKECLLRHSAFNRIMISMVYISYLAGYMIPKTNM